MEAITFLLKKRYSILWRLFAPNKENTFLHLGTSGSSGGEGTNRTSWTNGESKFPLCYIEFISLFVYYLVSSLTDPLYIDNAFAETVP